MNAPIEPGRGLPGAGADGPSRPLTSGSSGLLASLIVTCLAFAGCGAGQTDAPVILNGRIEAPLVDLATKVAGRVMEVRVREGDRVGAGDLLVLLDLGEAGLAVDRDRAGLEAARARAEDLASGSRDREIAAAEAEVDDRRAAHALARLERERLKRLLDEGVASRSEYDTALAEADRAAAALEASEQRLGLAREGFRRGQTAQARSDLDRAGVVLRQAERIAAEAEIRAPADGIILHRMAEPGLVLTPGQPALTMAFAERLYVRAFVPETALGRVRPGVAAEVRVDAHPDRSFPARVTEVSPQAEFTPKPVETRDERVHLVYPAKIDLDAGWDTPLVPGQPAEVILSGGP